MDVVYNPLVNSLHARWNLAALAAGKQVLSEKPMAANAFEAHAMRDGAAHSAGTIVEGFHYLHHPSVARIEELVRTGALGEITAVDVTLEIPSPPDSDPRWSYELAGGALMDLGCYVLNAHRQLARWARLAEPRVRSATAVLRAGQADVDEAMTVELDYLPGVPAIARWNMNASERRMVWTVTGARGSVTHAAFGVPHLDNRLYLRLDGRESVEALGDTTSYTYQLRRYAAFLAGSNTFPLDVADAVANAELMDAVLRAAGVALRGMADGGSFGR